MFNFVPCYLIITILLRILLIILLVYLVIRMFNRLMYTSYTYSDPRNQYESQQKRTEGSVTLEKTEKPEKIIPKDEGEYIDYEEVK